MKKIVLLFIFALFLAGCSDGMTELERGMALRSKLLQANAVSFVTDISADYGDKEYLFSMSCQGDTQGNVRFTVMKPDTIEGISGTIANGNGMLTFDDTALHFDLMTDEQLSPVSAPWILLTTLRSGYLSSAGMEDQYIRLTIDDSYEEDALQLDIWLNEEDLPERAEILYDGKNILTLVVREFQIL